jgi:hypothetical protein
MRLMLMYLAITQRGYVNKIIESLFVANKEVRMEVNAGNLNIIFVFHHQSAGQNHNIETGNKSFKSMTNFEYLE